MSGTFSRCLSNEECGAGYVCAGGICVFSPPADSTGNPIGCGDLEVIEDLPPIPDFDPNDCNNPYNFPCERVDDPNSPWYGFDPDDSETWPWDPRKHVNGDNMPAGNGGTDDSQGCAALPEPVSGREGPIIGDRDLGLPGLPGLNLPSFDLPEFNLPDFEFPTLNLPNFDPVGCGGAGPRCADGVLVDEDGNPILKLPESPGLDETYFNPDAAYRIGVPPQGTTVPGDPDTYPSSWTYPFFNENDPQTWPENQYPTFDPANPATWPSSESTVWPNFDPQDPATYPTRGGYDLVDQINPSDASTWPLNMDEFNPGDVTTWPYNGPQIDPLDPSTFPDPAVYPNFDPADTSTWPYGAGIPISYIDATNPETWPQQGEWSDFDPKDETTWPPGAISTRVPGQLEDDQPIPEDCGSCFIGGVQKPGKCNRGRRPQCTTFCHELWRTDPTDPSIDDLCYDFLNPLYCEYDCDICFDPADVWEGYDEEADEDGLGYRPRCIDTIEAIERKLIAPPSSSISTTIDCRCLQFTKYKEDFPTCWKCSYDGTLKPDCSDCSFCSKLPNYGCSCGLTVTVENCKSYCSSNPRTGLNELKALAERRCNAACENQPTDGPCGDEGALDFVTTVYRTYSSLSNPDFDPSNPPCSYLPTCSCRVVDMQEFTNPTPAGPVPYYVYQVEMRCYNETEENQDCKCEDPAKDCDCNADCPPCTRCNNAGKCEVDTSAEQCCDCRYKNIDVNVLRTTSYSDKTNCAGEVIEPAYEEQTSHVISLVQVNGYSAPKSQQIKLVLDCESVTSVPELPIKRGGELTYQQCFDDNDSIASRTDFIVELPEGTARGLYNQTIINTFTFSDGGTTCNQPGGNG